MPQLSLFKIILLILNFSVLADSPGHGCCIPSQRTVLCGHERVSWWIYATGEPVSDNPAVIASLKIVFHY